MNDMAVTVDGRKVVLTVVEDGKPTTKLRMPTQLACQLQSMLRQAVREIRAADAGKGETNG